MSVAATPEQCFAVAADLDRYPEWAADIKEVEVKERDEQGRPLLVTFRAAAFGRSTGYTLAYDFSDAPHSLSWKLTQGDITTKLDGSYVFDPG
jgi:ribosome-associated toxin RatA of RatAB toxin-antitoxin module